MKKVTKLTKTSPAACFSDLFRLACVVLLIGFVRVPRLSADELHATDTFTLERCLAIARQNSPELRIAANAVEASRLDRKLAGKARLPQVTLDAGAGYAPYSLHFGYDPAVSNGGELGARVVAQQTLYDAGQYGLRVKSAETDTARRGVFLQMQDRDLVYAVNLAFINVLMTERQLALRQRSVDRLSDYGDLVSSMNQSGAVSYTDLLNTQVQFAQAKIDAGDAAQAVASARLNLKRLIGFPDDTTITIVGSLDSLLIPAADTASAVRKFAPSQDVELKAARLDYARSRIALSMARAQWKPTISLTADAGVLTSRENLLLSPSDRYASSGYSVGISISMPLWDWDRRKTEVDRNVTEVKAAQNNIDLVRRNLLADYSDTRMQLITARRRLVSIRQVVQTAEKNYLLNKARYANGDVIASDVLLAQQALTEIRQSETETLAHIQSLKAQLDKITRTEQDTSNEISR